MAPFVLKFKGNKSFSPFSNLSDSDALTKTWRVCTKVAAHLEQGQRLENLSWRLWHLHNLMVEMDNAKSKREFKKLSRNMGERLDKDKGRNIAELQAPDFKHNQSTDKLRLRAEEKEKQLGRTGLKGMIFTFPVDPSTNNTPGATSAAPAAPSKKHHSLRVNPPRDEGDENMEVLNGTATGLVIDTNFNAPMDSALTPTTSATTDSARKVCTGSNRSRYRGHYDSIPPVPPAMSAFPTLTSPPSPDIPIPPPVNKSRPMNQDAKKDPQSQQQTIRFPSVFQNDFTPVALLCPAPSVKQGITYGEAIGFSGLANSEDHAEIFGITRPTFEFPLDELMNAETNSDVETSTSGGWNGEDGATNLTNSVSSLSIPTPVSASISMASFSGLQITPANNISEPMQGVHATGLAMNNHFDDEEEEVEHDVPTKKSPALLPSRSAPASPAMFASPPTTGNSKDKDTSFPPLSLPKGAILPGPSPTPSPAPAPTHHSVRRRYSTTNAPTSTEGKKGGRQPSATAPRNSRTSHGNSAPGGVKSECANCGANSTPLWRRGLNDELNCNACGLFAKLHKRPRPKSLRGSQGDGGTRNAGWATKGGVSDETGEPVVSCYNCATIATPLWRKDEEGRTLCNACGLYLKLHGERRPSSMKSDVIRKRSRHDARRGTSSSATPSASPGASRRTSPTPPPPSRSVHKTEDLSFSLTLQGNGRSPTDSSTSPYTTTSNSFEYTTPTQNQDSGPVDLISLNHSMGTDNGTDPALGGMTFSPGATYQETLHYPGPFSLSYFYGQYGENAQVGQNESNQNQNQQGQQHHQHQHQQQQHQHQQQQQQQQQQQSRRMSNATSQSPEVSQAEVMFGPQNNPGQMDAISMWDQPFQVPMTTPYSFNFAGQVVQGTQQDQGLGFVHPPMLPYWTADGHVTTKPEGDHDMYARH